MTRKLIVVAGAILILVLNVLFLIFLVIRGEIRERWGNHA